MGLIVAFGHPERQQLALRPGLGPSWDAYP